MNKVGKQNVTFKLIDLLISPLNHGNNLLGSFMPLEKETIFSDQLKYMHDQ